MALDFNGSNQYLNVNTTPVTAVPLTLACWFRPDGTTNQGCLMNVADTAANNNDFSLQARGADTGDPLRCNTRAGGVSNEANTSTGFSANVWQHACAVFASTTSRAVYLNGGSKGTNTNSATPTGIDAMAIGIRRRSDLQDPFDGKIAEAAIWNIALTDDDVLTLSKGVSPLLVKPANLIGYWPLIGKYSPEIDYINGQSMTYNGSPTVAEHPRIAYSFPRIIQSQVSVVTHNIEIGDFVSTNLSVLLTKYPTKAEHCRIAYPSNITSVSNKKAAILLEAANISAIDTNSNIDILYNSFSEFRIINESDFTPDSLFNIFASAEVNTEESVLGNNILVAQGVVDCVGEIGVGGDKTVGIYGEIEFVTDSSSIANNIVACISDCQLYYDCDVSISSVLIAAAQNNITTEISPFLNKTASISGSVEFIVDNSAITSNIIECISNCVTIFEKTNFVNSLLSVYAATEIIIEGEALTNNVVVCASDFQLDYSCAVAASNILDSAASSDISTEISPFLSKTAGIITSFDSVFETSILTHSILPLFVSLDIINETSNFTSLNATIYSVANLIFESTSESGSFVELEISYEGIVRLTTNINLTQSAAAAAQSIFENSHIAQSILSVFASTDLLLELVADNGSFVNIEISFDGIFENNHSLNLTRVIMAELHLESETVYTTNLIFSAQSEFSSFIDVVSLASLILDAATSFPVFTEYDPNIDLIVGLFGSLDIINKAGVLIDEALALEIVVSNDINIENSAILNRIISINSSFDTVTQLIISADFTAEFIALIFNYTMYIQREKDTILRTL